MALEDIVEPTQSAPEAAPAAEPSFDAPADSAPTPEAEPDVFDRAYVEKLRQEAAGHRTKYAPYKEIFEGADDDVREYVLDLSRQLISDPLGALEELDGLVAQLKEARGDVTKVEVPDSAGRPNPVSDKQQPMTRAEWEKIREEERDTETRFNELEKLKAEVRDLGYPEAEQDEFGDLASLLAIATRHTDGDLNKAHEKRAARFEAEVNKRVEAKIEAIRTGKEKWAPVSSTGTSPAPLGEKPKTLAEARKAAAAYIAQAAESQQW